MYKYFDITPTARIFSLRKSKGLSDETIKHLTPRAVFASELNYVGNKARLKFNRSCLTQNKIIFHHKK